MYTEPETVYETTTETKRITALRQGDVLGNERIRDVRRGHKYVTVFGHQNTQIFREPVDSERTVAVTVKRETDESRAAYRRWAANQGILEELERYPRRLASAKEGFEKRWAEWGELSYDIVGSMIEAEADHRLWGRFDAGLEHHLAEGLDHVAALTLYVDQLKDELLEGHRIRGFSQSSNHLSSLMEAAYTERMVHFVRESKYLGVGRE